MTLRADIIIYVIAFAMLLVPRSATAAATPPYRVIASGVNQMFCNRFYATARPDFTALMRGEASERLAPATVREDLPAAQPDSPVTQRTSIEAPVRAHDQLARLTPGARKRMFVWTGYSHYFDGDVIAIGSNDDYRAVQKLDVRFDDVVGIETATTTSPLPKGWTLLSGGRAGIYPGVSPRYVHFTPVSFEGMVMFFTFPTAHRVKPDAALISPDDNGGFRTLCAFQR